MANVSKPKNQPAVKKIARNPKCARCRNHGFLVLLKGHQGSCKFRQCQCWKCSLITERTKIVAAQRRIKSQKDQSHATANVDQVVPKTTVRDANIFGGIMGDMSSTPEKIVASALGNSLTSPDTIVRTESVIKTTARPTEVDGKTYTELDVPGINAWGVTDVHSAVQHWDANQEALLRNQHYFPGEYVRAMPFQLQRYSGYPNGYAYPAIMGNLRPPLEAFKVPFGFSPLPRGAVPYPPDTIASHDCFVPFFAPYPFACPRAQEECVSRLAQPSQAHKEREHGAREIVTRPRYDSDGRMQGNQGSDFVSMDNSFSSQETE